MNYNLLNGDCLQLMGTIPDNSVDMVLCDMPYGTTECKWDKTLDLTMAECDLTWQSYRDEILSYADRLKNY